MLTISKPELTIAEVAIETRTRTSDVIATVAELRAAGGLVSPLPAELRAWHVLAPEDLPTVLAALGC